MNELALCLYAYFLLSREKNGLNNSIILTFICFRCPTFSYFSEIRIFYPHLGFAYRCPSEASRSFSRRQPGAPGTVKSTQHCVYSSWSCCFASISRFVAVPGSVPSRRHLATSSPDRPSPSALWLSTARQHLPIPLPANHTRHN
jgi:hypothetical protein